MKMKKKRKTKKVKNAKNERKKTKNEKDTIGRKSINQKEESNILYSGMFSMKIARLYSILVCHSTHVKIVCMRV